MEIFLTLPAASAVTNSLRQATSRTRRTLCLFANHLEAVRATSTDKSALRLNNLGNTGLLMNGGSVQIFRLFRTFVFVGIVVGRWVEVFEVLLLWLA